MKRFHFRLKSLHYAWYILAVCFLLNMLVQALVMSVSNLYIVPMYHDLGVPRSLLTLQSTCIMISAILSAPVWGRLYKNGNTRKMLTARFFGGSSYGPVYGIIVSASRLGGGIGTLLAAVLFDLTGAYHIIWNCCLFMMLITLFAILLCFRITNPRTAQPAFIQEHA